MSSSSAVHEVNIEEQRRQEEEEEFIFILSDFQLIAHMYASNCRLKRKFL